METKTYMVKWMLKHCWEKNNITWVYWSSNFSFMIFPSSFTFRSIDAECGHWQRSLFGRLTDYTKLTKLYGEGYFYWFLAMGCGHTPSKVCLILWLCRNHFQFWDLLLKRPYCITSFHMRRRYQVTLVTWWSEGITIVGRIKSRDF